MDNSLLAPVQAQPFLVRDAGGVTHLYYEIGAAMISNPSCWLDLQTAVVIDTPTDVSCRHCFVTE